MMNLYAVFSKSILLALATTQTLWAIDTEKVNKVLKLVDRPTIQDVMDMLDGDLSQSHFNPNNSLMQKYQRDFAKIIVLMEMAYPGATFVGMGRDSSQLVNALDAFYLARGQKGRVLNLWASGGTIRSASQDQLNQALEQLGMDLNQFRNKPPFILFDTTYYNTRSQSKVVMRAVYSKAHNLGISLAELAKKVNFLNVYTGIGGEPVETTDLPDFFNHLQVYVDGPEKILMVPANDLTYGEEWSDTYLNFEQQADGTVRALPSAPSDLQTKQTIIGNIIALMQYAMSDRLYEEVLTQARARNFDFEAALRIREHNNQAHKPVAPKSWKERLDDLSLQPLPEERTYVKENNLKLTVNGHKIFRTILRNSQSLTQSEELATLLAFMVKAENHDQIGERDFQRILAFIINETLLDKSHVEILHPHQANSGHLYSNLSEKLSDAKDITETFKANIHQLNESLYSACAISLKASSK